MSIIFSLCLQENLFPCLRKQVSCPIKVTAILWNYLSLLQITIWRMPSSGLWRRVDLVGTEVSEACVASIFRLERIGEIGITEPHLGRRHSSSSLLCMSQMAERHHIPEDGILHNHGSESLKLHNDATFQKTAFFIRMSETTQWRHTPEDVIVHNQCCENRKTYAAKCLC
jgi:hypothetical protein